MTKTSFSSSIKADAVETPSPRKSVSFASDPSIQSIASKVKKGNTEKTDNFSTKTGPQRSQALLEQLETGVLGSDSQFFFDTVSYSHDEQEEKRQQQQKQTQRGREAEEEKKDDDNNNNDSFVWPRTLYEELAAMAEVSFLIYFLSYLVNVGRRNQNCSPGLKQLFADVQAGLCSTRRYYTPQMLLQLVQDDLDHLRDTPHFPDDPEHMVQSLQALVQRAQHEDSIQLVAYNDRNQDEELVYAVGVDHASRRITVILRGTEINQGLGVCCSDWGTNLRTTRKPMKLPESLRKLVDQKMTRVKLHQGFQERVFAERDGSNEAQERKYDEILAIVRRLCDDHPTYKIYCTGHSLGAAMSSIFAFLFASEPDLPKPISCINFASPRVGNHKFLRCCQALEREKQLRYCRVINKRDTVSTFPLFLYFHAGFQIVLRHRHVRVSYPRLQDAWWRKIRRSMRNSVTARMGVDLLDQHMKYRVRIQKLKELLVELNLNDLYADQSLTGFVVQYD